MFPGAKVARRSNAIPISARTSREPTIPPPTPHPSRPWNDPTMWTSTSGWVAERVDRGSKRGPPKGGVARRMGRYVCRERTADRTPSWNRCRSSGRKELLRSSGAAEVYPPLVCVCAPPHTPCSPPPLVSRVPSHTAFAVDPPSGCARMRENVEKKTQVVDSFFAKKWRLQHRQRRNAFLLLYINIVYYGSLRS